MDKQRKVGITLVLSGLTGIIVLMDYGIFTSAGTIPLLIAIFMQMLFIGCILASDG